MSDSLRLHGLEYARLPCPSPTPGAYSNSCPLSRWCHQTISSSVIPFSSCLQSFPASESPKWCQLKDRQREKALKKGTNEKSVDWSRNLRWKKYSHFLMLALICIVQPGDQRGTKSIRRGRDNMDSVFSFGVGPPSHLSILCVPNKTLSCNQAVALILCFKSLLQQDWTEEITHSSDTPSLTNKNKSLQKHTPGCTPSKALRKG